jgi:hypothetical protein
VTGKRLFRREQEVSHERSGSCRRIAITVAMAALVAVGVAAPAGAKVLGVNGPLAFEQRDPASP